MNRAKTGAKMHFIDPHATKNKKMPPFSSWRRRNNACLHFSVVDRLRKGGKFNLWSENQLSARFVELAPETKQTSHCRKSSRWKKGWGKNEGKVLNFPNAARVQHFLGVEKKKRKLWKSSWNWRQAVFRRVWSPNIFKVSVPGGATQINQLSAEKWP